MFVELEKTVAELKELTYRLSKYAEAYEKLAVFLKGDLSRIPSKHSVALSPLPTRGTCSPQEDREEPPQASMHYACML